MPPSGVWSNPETLVDVIVALYTMVHNAKAITAENKAMFEAHAKELGHTLTWDALRATMKWDQQVHEDILIALFQHIKLGGAEISKIMEELRDKGYTFTESALRQHVQKLRKTRDSAALKSDGAAADGGSSAPATPSKRTPGGKAKKGKGKAAAAANMQDNEEIDDDDDDDGGADLGKVFPPEAKVKVSASEGEEDEFPPEVLPPTKKGRKSRASQRKSEISLAEAAEGMI